MENEEFQKFSKNILDERGDEKVSSFKTSSDRKSLELLNSQDNVYQQFIEIFSQSPPSTNVSDFVNSSFSDTENVNRDAVQQPTLPSKYNLRSRTVMKQQRRKREGESEVINRNSGRGRPKGRRNHPATNEIEASGSEMEICSQESVSMLQDCYVNSKFLETPINSTMEMTNRNSDEEADIWNAGGIPQKSKLKTTVENCTQTEFPILSNVRKEKEITRHAKFVRCITRLKSVLSSKNKKVNINVHDILGDILKSISEETFDMAEDDGRDSILPMDALGYILRSSDSEKVYLETVRILLFHLESICKEDFLKIAGCWRDSIYEMAVDILNEAVDCDPGILKIVELFLITLLESILNDDGRSKNLLLESKAIIVVSFCKSRYLSFTLTYCIIKQLKRLKPKPLGRSTLEEKLSWSSFAKNMYFLIRILEQYLESFKTKLENKEIDVVRAREQEIKNFNVLEMWKKFWRADETSTNSKPENEWKLLISKWLDDLDEVLLNCVNYFPLSALAVERCKSLVIEISKICYPEEE